jgi:hypothetical protein
LPPYKSARHRAGAHRRAHLLASRHRHEFATRLRERFAVLTDENGGAAIDVRFQARKRLAEDARTLREGESGPPRLRGLCGSDRLVHVTRCTLHDRAHELVRPCRIFDFDPLGAIDGLAVDQHVFGDRRFGVG